jgi:hypothetical protein
MPPHIVGPVLLRDEPCAVVLVACPKCEWRAAFERSELIAAYGANCPMRTCSTRLQRRAAQSSDQLGIGAAFISSSRSKECEMPFRAPLTVKRAEASSPSGDWTITTCDVLSDGAREGGASK